MTLSPAVTFVLSPTGGDAGDGGGVHVRRADDGRLRVQWLPSCGEAGELAVPEALDGDPAAAASFLLALGMIEALTDARGDIAVVVGTGLLADLARSALGTRLRPAGTGPEPSAPDLVVDTTGDPRCWLPILSSAAPGGTVVCVVPPWVDQVDLDVYPSMHRRSLQLTARRWHRPADADADADASDAIAHAIAITRAASARWIVPSESVDPAPGSWALSPREPM